MLVTHWGLLPLLLSCFLPSVTAAGLVLFQSDLLYIGLVGISSLYNTEG